MSLKTPKPIAKPLGSRSRNDIAQHIEQGKKKRHYKDCAHLTVGGSQDAFRPDCKLDSFDDYYRLPRSGGVEIVPQCPRDCFYFVDRTKAERAKKWKARGETLKKLWSEFKSLPQAVQILLLCIILVVVLWLAAPPDLLSQFIELIRAIRGN